MTTQQRLMLCIVLAALCCLPVLCIGDWQSASRNYSAHVRIWMAGPGVILMLLCLVWAGAQWMAARCAGSRSHTFMGYLEQTVVLVVIGCTLVLLAAAWQVCGYRTSA